MEKVDIDDVIRKRVLSLAEEDTEEGRQWRNVVNAFMEPQEDLKEDENVLLRTE